MRYGKGLHYQRVLLAGKQGDVVIKDAPDFFRNSIADNLQINNKNVAGRETARLSELTGKDNVL